MYKSLVFDRNTWNHSMSKSDKNTWYHINVWKQIIKDIKSAVKDWIYGDDYNQIFTNESNFSIK